MQTSIYRTLHAAFASSDGKTRTIVGDVKFATLLGYHQTPGNAVEEIMLAWAGTSMSKSFVVVSEVMVVSSIIIVLCLRLFLFRLLLVLLSLLLALLLRGLAFLYPLFFGFDHFCCQISSPYSLEDIVPVAQSSHAMLGNPL
jgi:hypothetical protein